MKYLIPRRLVQVGLLALYFGANAYGWKVLEGNLSGSLLLGTVPLADPYAVLQMLFAGAVLASDVLIGALVIALFYGIVGGRAFCSWVCPVNLVTDLANWLRRKLGISAVQKRVYMSRSIRYWVLGLSLLLGFLALLADLALFCAIFFPNSFASPMSSTAPSRGQRPNASRL